MDVTNLTVCTEEPYFHSNCNTTTTLSVVPKSLVIAGLSKKNNLKCLNKYFKNKSDRTKKIKRAKRSKNQLSNYEVDDALKSSDFSEPRNEIKKTHIIAKKENADYNNIVYDWNYENKHNADIGKYYIDEPRHLIKEKHLNKLTQNDTLFYLSKPTHKNKTDAITNNIQRIANKEVTKHIEFIATKSDEEQEANVSKNEYMNQPKQKRVSKPKNKRNFLVSANNNKKYDRLKLTNETKLMDEAQYYIDNDYFFTTTNKPQNKYNVEKSNQLPDTNKVTDTNNPQRTITPDYANVKRSSVKRKYTRGEEEKYLLNEYGPEDIVMIEDARNLSVDEYIFTPKLITSSTSKQQEMYTRPWMDITKEETYFYRQFKTGITPNTTPYEPFKVRYRLTKTAVVDLYEPGQPAKALHGLYRFNLFKFRKESNKFAFEREAYKEGTFLYCIPCIFLFILYVLAWLYSCCLCPRKVRTYKRCQIWKVKYYRKITRISVCLTVFWGFLGALTIFVEHDQIDEVTQRYYIPFTKLIEDLPVRVMTHSN